MASNSEPLFYTITDKVLKITVERTGIQAIHSVTRPSGYEPPVSFEHSFEPKEILYDKNGLVRYFTYENQRGERFEFMAQNLGDDTPWASIAIKFTNVIMIAYDIYRHADKYHSTFRKVKENQLTEKEAFRDLEFWHLKNFANKWLFNNIRHSSSAQNAMNALHDKMMEVFPSLKPNNDVNYYEKNGKYMVKGALHIW